MSQQIAEFDPLSQEFLDNPWAEFKRMRESCRAYRHEGTMEPVVSFFHDDDIRAMRADWETWSSSRSAVANKKGLGVAAVMIGQDPPDHTKYRNIIAPLFMPGRVHALQPAIDKHVGEILDQVIGAGEVDFMEDVSASLATAIIGTICGIPESDWKFVRGQTIESSRDYGKGSFFKAPVPEIEARLASIHKEFGTYVVQHVQTLRRTKTPSILTTVAEQVDDDMALLGLCLLILGAGNDTSSNLMTNGFWELMQKPDQMAWLRANPDKVPQAIEEAVRCRGSLRRSERVAARDLMFDGVEVNKGDVVALWNASASRDPKVVPDRPDEFDITRKPTRHMGFGAGIHMCIGNILARLETRTLWGEVLRRTSSIEETRGADSYQSWGNGVLDAVRSYHVSLAA